MLHLVFHCILVVYLACLCNSILIGRLRQKEEPDSNILRTSRFLFPKSDEQPSCKTDHGHLGQCVDVRMCYAARRAVIAGNQPVRCGWINNFIPRVCCHPDQVATKDDLPEPEQGHRRTDYF
ncbi:uncharacterized protein CEXT_42581 [Caerostris extrusa]|uniref:CLIP domain-containing serine protease n=1 Tax=Caerostris extrusa TaxID=172846 RepID=A0AAV4QIQ1_CAEEX|nr:uncharacterized protein CEXT_42581 [Caerostris extrusa]